MPRHNRNQKVRGHAWWANILPVSLTIGIGFLIVFILSGLLGRKAWPGNVAMAGR